MIPPPPPRLPEHGLTGREGVTYDVDPGLRAAADAALALEVPLLLTGEAGCGKTDFAFAAASGLPDAAGRTHRPLECYVRSDSRARDLLYRYDAVERFGEAQIAGVEAQARLHAQPEQGGALDAQAEVRAAMAQVRDPRNYIRLEGLGEALVSPIRRVVLIDEIDKAQRDLPNDLLRELDQRWFEILEIRRDLGPAPGPDGAVPAIDPTDPSTWRRRMQSAGTPAPLVIITSNVERQLPHAFLRRCVFYHLPFPDKERLDRILTDHAKKLAEDRGAILTAPEITRMVQTFRALRVFKGLEKPPATAELIGWMKATALGPRWAALQAMLTADFEPALTETPEGDWPRVVKTLTWMRLQRHGLSCLIKLHEDLVRLRASAPRPAPEGGGFLNA